MKLNSLFYLFTLLIIFSVVGTAEQSSFTNYDLHNGELCYGLHIGDSYTYEETRGEGIVYINDTFFDRINYAEVLSINITEAPNGLTQHSSYSDTTYKFDLAVTNLYNNEPTITFEWLWKYYWDQYNFFTYIDWNTWENVYFNLTQDAVESNWDNEHHLVDFYYIYPENTNSLFTIRYFGGDLDYTIASSHTYNKSDGSLLSWMYEVQRPTEEGVRKSFHWREVILISKQKVSDEKVCPVVQQTNEDDGPFFNIVYLVFLIPITRMKKSAKRYE